MQDSIEDSRESKVLGYFHEHCRGHHILSHRRIVPDNRCETCICDNKNKDCKYYEPVSNPRLTNFEVEKSQD